VRAADGEGRMGGKDLEWFLYRMLLIRYFEEKVAELYRAGEIYGHVHLSVGQEAVPVGVAAALEEGDVVTSTHRGHGHCLAVGADPARMMAELFGRATGYCKGKGGSMHVADVSRGILGANGVVAGGVPHAVGAALALRKLGRPSVAVAFFGEGALNQGVLWEAANLAALWELPVVFVCENNQYAITTPFQACTAGDPLMRARGFGLWTVDVDGMDVLAVAQRAAETVQRARSGAGPAFLNCRTYRFRGHTEGEEALGWRYREEAEVQAWRHRDPILRLERHGQETGRLLPETVERIREEVRRVVDSAVEFARSSPEPALSELTADVWA
jgi:TPP-dependent pyruvate/acetoin dehydrogenase alpha subunit